MWPDPWRKSQPSCQKKFKIRTHFYSILWSSKLGSYQTTTSPSLACCPIKTVGGVKYTLAGEENTTKFGCIDSCVYTEENESTRVCFSQGNETAVCDKGNLWIMILTNMWLQMLIWMKSSSVVSILIWMEFLVPVLLFLVYTVKSWRIWLQSATVLRNAGMHQLKSADGGQSIRIQEPAISFQTTAASPTPYVGMQSAVMDMLMTAPTVGEQTK